MENLGAVHSDAALKDALAAEVAGRHRTIAAEAAANRARLVATSTPDMDAGTRAALLGSAAVLLPRQSSAVAPPVPAALHAQTGRPGALTPPRRPEVQSAFPGSHAPLPPRALQAPAVDATEPAAQQRLDIEPARVPLDGGVHDLYAAAPASATSREPLTPHLVAPTSVLPTAVAAPAAPFSMAAAPAAAATDFAPPSFAPVGMPSLAFAAPAVQYPVAAAPTNAYTAAAAASTMPATPLARPSPPLAAELVHTTGAGDAAARAETILNDRRATRDPAARPAGDWTASHTDSQRDKADNALDEAVRAALAQAQSPAPTHPGAVTANAVLAIIEAAANPANGLASTAGALIAALRYRYSGMGGRLVDTLTNALVPLTKRIQNLLTRFTYRYEVALGLATFTNVVVRFELSLIVEPGSTPQGSTRTPPR